jgi:hypothetical protein
LALTLRRKTAQALALRTRTVLACADEQDHKVVAARQRVTPQMVTKWRARFVEYRLDVRLSFQWTPPGSDIWDDRPRDLKRLCAWFALKLLG